MQKRAAVFVVFALLVSAWGAVADTVVKLDVKVPMQDGTQLSTNIFLPSEEGSFPVILHRTPYGNGDADNGIARMLAQIGYAFISQDVRGRFESEGIFEPFIAEAQDGYETQEWVRQQSWCNGSIGTMGGSYDGFTQWLPAPLQSPALKTMLPLITFMDFHDDVAYIGGAFQLSLALGWASMVTAQEGEDVRSQAEAMYQAFPLNNYASVLGREIPFYNDWMSHPNDDDYWASATIRGKHNRVQLPTLSIGNWYDIFAKATTDNFREMRESAATDEIRQAQRLIMGAGAHGAPGPKIGDRELGEEAELDVNGIQLRWFEHWLKGKKNGVMETAPVRIFVMGINEWRDEQEWPLARTRYTNVYLHSDGNANTLNGGGFLSFHAPEGEGADHYRYDPNDPVPTKGGANLTIPSGAFDQREVEERQDVLVYTSLPLESPIEVTGPIHVVLYAASSATDTDFTAKLVDVDPDGTAWNLTDSIIRARYRNSDTEPELIEPSKIYPYTIDLWVTSNVFLKGHRIRLEISSSNFPRFDRNPNTGSTFAADGEMVVAEQTIYHSKEYPSHLVLPVIPSNQE